jgi:hypothetical protein
MHSCDFARGGTSTVFSVKQPFGLSAAARTPLMHGVTSKVQAVTLIPTLLHFTYHHNPLVLPLLPTPVRSKQARGWPQWQQNKAERPLGRFAW